MSADTTIFRAIESQPYATPRRNLRADHSKDLRGPCGGSDGGNEASIMKAALLARVSDESQAEGSRHSLPFQLSLMATYASERGWDVVRVFELPGESAFRDYITDRPQFREAITAALRRDFDVLVVYDLSRFARNQAVLHETLRDLRHAGIALKVVTGDWDATEDRTRAGLEGIIAEAHSLDHSRRVRHAYSRRHDLGLPTGDVPFGYQRAKSASWRKSVVSSPKRLRTRSTLECGWFATQ